MTAPAVNRAAPYTRALAGIEWPDWMAWSVRVSDRRRSIGATVEPPGVVTFAVPAAATPDRVADYARRLRGRIINTAADVRDNGVRIVAKELVDGEGFDFAGRPNRLRLVDAGPPCELRRLPIGQPRPDGTGSMGSLPYLALRREHANARTVIEWYRQRGQEWLDGHMPHLCDRVGIPADQRPTWSVRPYRRAKGYGGAWGTYRPATHSIDVDWLVFQFPRERLEYVGVHEAAHAKLRGSGGHGRVWQLVVARALPDWRELDKVTREAARLSLWLGDITAPAPASDPFVSAWSPSDVEVSP